MSCVNFVSHQSWARAMTHLFVFITRGDAYAKSGLVQIVIIKMHRVFSSEPHKAVLFSAILPSSIWNGNVQYSRRQTAFRLACVSIQESSAGLSSLQSKLRGPFRTLLKVMGMSSARGKSQISAKSLPSLNSRSLSSDNFLLPHLRVQRMSQILQEGRTTTKVKKEQFAVTFCASLSRML